MQVSVYILQQVIFQSDVFYFSWHFRQSERELDEDIIQGKIKCKSNLRKITFMQIKIYH